MFPSACTARMITPTCVLPEMTLRAPLAGPPTVLAGAPSMTTPALVLPRELVPVMSTPMKLPRTWLPAESDPTMNTPARLRPERTFRAAGAVPPMTLPKD